MEQPSVQRPRVAVIGDVMLDHYLWGKCERISPEAPVQVVAIDKENTVLGGAGNVINNLKALECDVTVASVIGSDEAGSELMAKLDGLGVATRYLIREPERKTSKKSRILASNQQIVRFDNESTTAITSESENALLETFATLLDDIDIAIISDYGKGVLTPTLTQKLIAMLKSAHIKVLVDPKGKDYSKYYGATLITPNKKEASEATGLVLNTQEAIKIAGYELKNRLGLECALITLSEDGIAIFDETMRIHPTVAQEVYDVTGAGDTVIASLGYALAIGKTIDEAVIFANAAAAVVVGKIGSATATHAEIEAYQTSIGHHSSHRHIKTFHEIEAIAQQYKDKKIVFTNGCFDILHAGHVSYLETAKSFGDILIVGVNADSSVRKLKGESRPINPQEDRAYLIAALHAVDYVVIFEEETPWELINRIKPHTLVKGGDYEGKTVVGSDIAQEVKLVTFVEGKSTTQTITKIKEQSLC